MSKGYRTSDSSKASPASATSATSTGSAADSNAYRSSSMTAAAHTSSTPVLDAIGRVEEPSLETLVHRVKRVVIDDLTDGALEGTADQDLDATVRARVAAALEEMGQEADSSMVDFITEQVLRDLERLIDPG